MSHDGAQRAGRYIVQSAGYRAFIPAPLPPDPPLDWGDALQEKFAKSLQVLTRLNGAIGVLPNPRPFASMCLCREAVFSSQIEGIPTTLQDVLWAESPRAGTSKSQNTNEAHRLLQAMRHGLARLVDLPVCVRLIREMHTALMRETVRGRLQPGELRTSQNWIGPTGSSIRTATFIPPPPHEVPRALSDLEKFLHEDAVIHPLVKIGLAHVQFETIHPFLDGNGRIGRALIVLLLIEKGLLSEPVLDLSRYLLRHRNRYYEYLQVVRKEGDWEGWLAFFLDGVIEVGEQVTQTIAAVLRMLDEQRTRIIDGLGRAATNGLRVLVRLLEHPIVDVATVREWLRLTPVGTNQIVAKLEDIGVLREISGYARSRRFRFDPYIRLFEEDTG